MLYSPADIAQRTHYTKQEIHDMGLDPINVTINPAMYVVPPRDFHFKNAAWFRLNAGAGVRSYYNPYLPQITEVVYSIAPPIVPSAVFQYEIENDIIDKLVDICPEYLVEIPTFKTNTKYSAQMLFVAKEKSELNKMIECWRAFYSKKIYDLTIESNDYRQMIQGVYEYDLDIEITNALEKLIGEHNG